MRARRTGTTVTLTRDRADRARMGVARICATAPDETTLLSGIAARLQPVVPYDVAAWLTTDPATMLFTDGLIQGFPASTCQPWFDNELGSDDVHKFVDLARGPLTAELSSASPEHVDSERWQDVMRPIGLDAEARGTFVDATGCWGTVELHREVGAPAFTPDELALLRDVGGEITGGLRRLIVEREARKDARADGPGLFYVHADGSVSAGTEAGAAWLELLVDSPSGEEWSAYGYRSTSLYAVGAFAKGGVDRPRRTRARAADGRWVTLHASPTTDGDGATAVIVEPMRPAEIAGMLTLAYGLTEREHDVAMAVARGEPTEDIAAGLFISVHTVRDHLKSTFAKVGASSRTELVARLFTDHYAAAFHGRVAAH